MTEEELYDVFMFYEMSTYQASRKGLDDKFTFTWCSKQREFSKYAKWYARFMAKAYLDRSHSETEPLSYQ